MEHVLSEARERRLHTDFDLVSDNGRDEIAIFPVHRLLLILHSIFFKTFFESQLNNDRSSMVIRDGSPHTVDIFINFIYTNSWNLDDARDLQPDLETIKEVIILAHQDMVQPLINIIITHCKKNCLTRKWG